MKSIDTFYNNNFFRSRLEARWAVFFREAGIKYEYEPEGFKNSAGDKYLPDFYLPNTSLRGDNDGVYIEIKHQDYDKCDIPQSQWFDKPLVLFTGLPINHIYGNFTTFIGGYELAPIWDDFMMIWKCSKCKASKIAYDTGNNDFCHKCNEGRCNMSELRMAAQGATKARFEYNYFNSYQ